MIISRTPFRISFFGGGTDYPDWYRRHGGAVLASTIDKYCYLFCRQLPPFFDHKHRVVYSKIELTADVNGITHPAVREVLRYLNIEDGVCIQHDGDLPARSGLGSSSTFTVGLLRVLYALKGSMPFRHDLAKDAIYIEQERLRETVGCQDQVQAAYGGLNHIQFFPNNTFQVTPLTLAADQIRDLNDHLMLFFTGIQRTSSMVARTYVQHLDTKERQMHEIAGMVEEGLSILRQGKDLAHFGKLLHESWKLKRSLGEQISNKEVGKIYDAAVSAGALGGKLLGAGGGGFMVLFAHPQDQARVRDALRGLTHVPFNFEFEGSQLIFYRPEEQWAARCAPTKRILHAEKKPSSTAKIARGRRKAA